MSQTQADRRARAVIHGLRTLAQDERDRRRSPTSLRVEGALFALLAPRLAHDAEMPDLGSAVEGLDRGNMRRSRKLVADRVRRAMRGKLGRDADLNDLEELLAALEEGLGEEEADDHTVEAEFGCGGDPEDVTRDPWPEARDHPLMTATDAPDPFPGMPRPGGSMVTQPHEDHNDTRFPQHGRPADARDFRPRHAYDNRPRSFLDRFRFTKNTRGDDGTSRPMLSE